MSDEKDEYRRFIVRWSLGPGNRFSKRLAGPNPHPDLDPEEVVSQVAADWLERRKKIEATVPRARWVQYVFGMARLEYLERRRKLLRRAALLPMSETPAESVVDRLAPTPDDAVLDEEKAAAVARAIERLNESDAELIRLKFFAGWSNDEIAGLRGVEASTIRGQISRACDKIRNLATHDTALAPAAVAIAILGEGHATGHTPVLTGGGGRGQEPIVVGAVTVPAPEPIPHAGTAPAEIHAELLNETGTEVVVATVADATGAAASEGCGSLIVEIVMRVLMIMGLITVFEWLRGILLPAP